MTRRRVVRRFFFTFTNCLPCVVDELKCGHFAVNPGCYSQTRLCSARSCYAMSVYDMPSEYGKAIHLTDPCGGIFCRAPKPKGKRTWIRTGRVADATCLRCLRRWWQTDVLRCLRPAEAYEGITP